MASATTRTPDWLERGLAPLDAVRGWLLRHLRVVARPFIRDRALRVATMGSLLMLTALSTTVLAPFWLLAIGPIVLGVPHVVADIRYLVVRPGYHRRLALAVVAGVPIAAAAAGAGVAWGLVAAGGAVLVSTAPTRKKAVGALLLGGLAALTAAGGDMSILVFAYAHNLIAVALWWAWRPRTRPLRVLPLILFGLAIAAIFLLPSDWLLRPGVLLSAPGGMGAAYYTPSLAPGVAGDLAVRLVLFFAFTQSVHYAIWLRLVPEDDRPQPTPRSFRASYRALRQDLGRWVLAASALLALVVAVWAVVDLAAARLGYLRAATFHAHIELVAAALLWAEGRRP